MAKFVVLGAGTWGTTLGMLLSKQGHQGWLWDNNPDWLSLLKRERSHPRLKQPFPELLEIAENLPELLPQAEFLLGVIPCGGVREACQVIAPDYQGQLFISCSKGIEKNTFKLPHQVIQETLGKKAVGRVVALTGPSHAEEVCRDKPTAILLAAESLGIVKKASEFLAGPRFFPHLSSDIIGAELGGALKNVVAIACGISRGIGGGDNTQSALITIGLAEILRLGEILGAKKETLYGLGGLGDLLVTCMSIHSRNNNFGKLLGAGHSTEEAMEKIGMVVEGVYTVKTAAQLAKKYQIKTPLIQGVEALLNGQMDADQMICQLLQA